MNKRFGLLAAVVLAATALVGCAAQPTEEDYKKWANENGYVLADPALPAARLSGANANDFTNGASGIQILPTVEGQESLLDYLGRDDVRYIDLRDMQKGYLAGHIAGFESIEYFGLISNVGNTDTLYNCTTVDGVSTFEANYVESDQVLELLFPKDQTYFVMCGGGVRVVPFMQLLASKGYDMSRIYNVGGWSMIKGAKAAGLNYPLSTSAKVSATVTYDFSQMTRVSK